MGGLNFRLDHAELTVVPNVHGCFLAAVTYDGCLACCKAVESMSSFASDKSRMDRK